MVICCSATLVWTYPVVLGLSAAAAASLSGSPAASCAPECCSMCPTWRPEVIQIPPRTVLTQRPSKHKLNASTFHRSEPKMCAPEKRVRPDSWESCRSAGCAQKRKHAGSRPIQFNLKKTTTKKHTLSLHILKSCVKKETL